jgi:acyl-CoA synthetase (AMP-forming)/AMP-acid ligase II/acyl carrier protein
MSDLGGGAAGKHEEAKLAGSGPNVQGLLNRWRTIGPVIQARAAVDPGSWAIAGTKFAPLSYGELQQQIDELRAQLRRSGFDRYARIAVGLAESAEAAWTIVALACSAAAVPLDPKLTKSEIEQCLLLLRPNALLLLRGADTAARSAAEQHRVPIIEATVARRDRLGLQLDIPQIGPASSDDDADPEAPAFILHTSGTTAEPNLVPFSHRNVLASAERVQTWFDITPRDRCLNVSPVYYSHALTTTVMPPLLTGGSVAFPADPLNVDLSEWFGALRPTWYSAGPTVHFSVLNKANQRLDTRSIHSLRFISSAGAALPKEVLEGMQNVLRIPVLQHYGSSETAQIAANRPPPGPSKPGTCGIPWPDIVIIVGEDGQPLPPGEHGEILVSGPSVTSGYLNAPELNQKVFVDGWYRTGDIGSIDEQGFLSLHARKRELINRGAEKIAPLEIDHALMRHPAVAEAAAFGVVHPTLGEEVGAAVVLRPGSKATTIELREFLMNQLAEFKIPRRIFVVHELPKGITGKIQRMRLSDAVSGTVTISDEYLQPETSQLWRKLKQLATIKARRCIAIVGETFNIRPQGMPAGCKSSDATFSEVELHEALLQIWKRLLKVEDLCIDDDFFEKGGNSLLTMDLHVEIQKLTGKPPPESLLSKVSTIRSLSKTLCA